MSTIYFRFPAFMNDAEKRLAEKIEKEITDRLNEIKEFKDSKFNYAFLYYGKGTGSFDNFNTPIELSIKVLNTIYDVIREHPEVN
jgi:hypothetical protein